MSQDLLKKAHPSHEEAIFAFFISALVLTMMVYGDTNLHDYYNRPILSHCYPDNHDKFCTDQRKLLGVPDNAQMELGDLYAKTMLGLSLWATVIVVALRFMMGLLAGDRHYGWLIGVSLLWGLTAIVLFGSGWSDWGYYFFRDMPLPETLPWLNETGFFAYTKVFGDDPALVESSDLGITMMLGVGVVGGIWVAITHQHRRHLKRKMKR